MLPNAIAKRQGKIMFKKDMVPRSGIEPPTLRSSGACSTTELPRHGKIIVSMQACLFLSTSNVMVHFINFCSLSTLKITPFSIH